MSDSTHGLVALMKDSTSFEVLVLNPPLWLTDSGAILRRLPSLIIDAEFNTSLLQVTSISVRGSQEENPVSTTM